MNVGNYSRALISTAVMGVTALGPVALAGPADADPGGNERGKAVGHSKAAGSRPGQAGGQGATGDSQAGGNGTGNSQGHGHGAGHGNSNGRGDVGGGSPSNGGGNGDNNAGGNGNGHGHTPAGGNHGNGGHHPGGQAAPGGGGDPAGNNGTVKIETAGAADGTPDNVPHVGCDIQVEWYGFDAGDDIVSTVSFVPHAPTGDVVLGGVEPSRVFVGGDPASGAGTASGLDGVQSYHLTFDGVPHPQQGYHVKLTIHTPGSIGADTKHKVFWVQPCEEQPPGEDEQPPGEEEQPPGEEEQPPGEEEQPPGDAEVLGEQDRAHGLGIEVAGKQATRQQASSQQAATSAGTTQVPAVVEAGLGAGTVVGRPLALLVTLLGLLVAAAGYLVRRRRA